MRINQLRILTREIVFTTKNWKDFSGIMLQISKPIWKEELHLEIILYYCVNINYAYSLLEKFDFSESTKMLIITQIQFDSRGWW